MSRSFAPAQSAHGAVLHRLIYRRPELQQQLDEEGTKNRKLEAQFKFRVGSFVRRESAAGC